MSKKKYDKNSNKKKGYYNSNKNNGNKKSNKSTKVVENKTDNLVKEVSVDTTPKVEEIEVLDVLVEPIVEEQPKIEEVIVPKVEKKKVSLGKILFFLFWIIITILLTVLLGYMSFDNNDYYEVRFEVGDGTEVSNQHVLKGEKVVEPKDPILDGYEFEYWMYKDEEYDFDTKVESDLTLEAKWKSSEPEEYEFLPLFIQCYDKKLYDENEYQLVTSPQVGDDIICFFGFETYADDNVEKLEFDLVYGQGVRLKEVLNDSELTDVDDTRYVYEYKNPLPIAEAGAYVFRVSPAASEIRIELRNVEMLINGKKYITEDVEYLASIGGEEEEVEEETPVVDVNEYVPYKSDSFYIQCYDKTSVDENNFIYKESVKKGDKLVCFVGYETNAKDKVSVVQYDLKFGNGVKIIDENLYDNGRNTDGHYLFRFDPTPVNDIAEYVVEVVDDTDINNLYIGLANIMFETSNNNKYSNKDNILNFELEE